MKKLLAALLLLTFLVTSCVVIAGQRFSWYHDQEKDTLRILIHYDGIHEGSGSSEKGPDQLAKFITDGDILLLDWWGHLELGPIRAKLKTGNMLEKMVARSLTSFQIQAVGHYTDPAGRIGALQLITVPKISRFMKNLNKMINAAVLAELLREKQLPKTMERWREAAGEQHTWAVLDGHAIRVTIPTHPSEVGKMKFDILSQLVSRAFAKEGDEHKALVKRIVRQIAYGPVSYIEEQKQMTIVFGYKETPVTIRITTRDEYNTKLHEAVKKNVKTDLDQQFGTALVKHMEQASNGGEAKPIPGLWGDLYRWGPPEDQLGALLKLASDCRQGHRLKGDTPEESLAKVLFTIQQFGKRWAAAGMAPPAPSAAEEPEVFCNQWAEWYVKVTGRAPLNKDE